MRKKLKISCHVFSKTKCARAIVIIIEHCVIGHDGKNMTCQIDAVYAIYPKCPS